MKIGLENPTLNDAKYDGGFNVKNFSYIFSLFIGKHCMESKITEYAICR